MSDTDPESRPEIVPFRRSFPLELMFLVFEQSDTSTLAALGAVSMDVLEATAPLLYTTVEVRSVDGLEKLFCGRKEESKSSLPSRINHLLTLSEIKTFHLNLLSTSLRPPNISVARITPSTPIPLNLLRISMKFYNSAFLIPLHANLFPHFDPVRIEYDSRGRYFRPSPAYTVSAVPLPSIFYRAVALNFKGVLPIIRDSSTSPVRIHLAYLPIPTISRRRTVRLHLATLLSSDAPDTTSLVQKLSELAAFHFELMQEESTVLVVRTEEERMEAEEAVGNLDEGKRSKFAVELEA